ncbi:MAG TPA: hypothetical protein ENN21_02155, partial [Spirochaetes bacterium]|nr:hypothetical protein [Spirochaetota bacterium]
MMNKITTITGLMLAVVNIYAGCSSVKISDPTTKIDFKKRPFPAETRVRIINPVLDKEALTDLTRIADFVISVEGCSSPECVYKATKDGATKKAVTLGGDTITYDVHYIKREDWVNAIDFRPDGSRKYYQKIGDKSYYMIRWSVYYKHDESYSKAASKEYQDYQKEREGLRAQGILDAGDSFEQVSKSMGKTRVGDSFMVNCRDDYPYGSYLFTKVNGTDIYDPISRVCESARHAGVIQKVVGGGWLKVTVVPGQLIYKG